MWLRHAARHACAGAQALRPLLSAGVEQPEKPMKRWGFRRASISSVRLQPLSCCSASSPLDIIDTAYHRRSGPSGPSPSLRHARSSSGAGRLSDIPAARTTTALREIRFKNHLVSPRPHPAMALSGPPRRIQTAFSESTVLVRALSNNRLNLPAAHGAPGSTLRYHQPLDRLPARRACASAQDASAG